MNYGLIMISSHWINVWPKSLFSLFHCSLSLWILRGTSQSFKDLSLVHLLFLGNQTTTYYLMLDWTGTKRPWGMTKSQGDGGGYLFIWLVVDRDGRGI